MTQLTITPWNLSELPSEDALLAAGTEILNSVTSWKAGKTFHDGVVRTFSRPKVDGDGAPWHYRVSEHAVTEATFDDFAEKLCKDKPENQKNFIHSIKKVTLIKKVSESQHIWSIYHELPPPISPRIFTVLQTIHVDQSSPRTGLVVSIPIDLTSDATLLALEEKAVKGHFVSVERITELADGKTKWEMATSSTPGGNIPSFVSERAMDGQIANDVPLLLKYMKEHPTPATATQTAPTATSGAPAPTTST